MKHLINPQVDCVFKSLLGAEENKALLINFLNAVLTPPLDKQIIEVTLLNPYNKREFINDKSTIVDIKAKEQNGHLFQIEIQLQVGPELPARMAYTWADIYHNQLGKGDGFYLLQPIVSIWLLGDNLKVIRQSDAFHHCFKLYDPSNQVLLTDHCQIHTLELKKWSKGDIKDDIDYWSWLFSQGDHLDIDHLPSFITDNSL
ncbi:MAG: Rpn family recombination-promoting nuclease/putative transposase, partial [Pseudomonadales bacterium]